MKVCSICNKSKRYDKFFINVDGSIGFRLRCITCMSGEKKAIKTEKIMSESQTKVCRACKTTLPIGLFWNSKDSKDGKDRRCKDCTNQQILTYRNKNRDKYNGSMRERNRVYNQKFPEKRYLNEIKRKYGATPEIYYGLLEKQNKLCVICGKEHDPTVKKGRLYMDHDHKTLKLRELICSMCNCMLGYACEDFNLLFKGFEYLKRHS